MAKIKNIIIFTVIAGVFILIYIFYIRSSTPSPSLVSSASKTTLPNIDGSSSSAGKTSAASTFAAQDFLTILLNVKNIKLDDTIFSDPAFMSLHDSSIILTGDGTEGRTNPFAQFGSDSVPANNGTAVKIPPALTIPPPTSVPPKTKTTPTKPSGSTSSQGSVKIN